jgi:putative transposon-encoded protein
MKIKITKEIKELDGIVIEKTVTPFGTSAHIPFSRNHRGKIVSVIIPTNIKYSNIFSKEELKKIINACEKILKNKKENKILFYQRESIKNLKEKEFSYNDLVKVLSILNEDKTNFKLIEKLKYYYAL